MRRLAPQVPRPSHAEADAWAVVHEVPVAAGAQDPEAPHASHMGQAAAMQQTPSTQWPLGHSGADVQPLPSALVDAQTPATQ